GINELIPASRPGDRGDSKPVLGDSNTPDSPTVRVDQENVLHRAPASGIGVAAIVPPTGDHRGHVNASPVVRAICREFSPSASTIPTTDDTRDPSLSCRRNTICLPSGDESA